MNTVNLMHPTVDCPMFRKIIALIRQADSEEQVEESVQLLLELCDNWTRLQVLEMKQATMQVVIDKFRNQLAALKAGSDDDDDDEDDEPPRIFKKKNPPVKATKTKATKR